MAKSKRSIEKEEFWRLALREHQQSGLTIRAFCQREGLSEPAFYAWRKKIDHPKPNQGSGSASELGALLPVKIVDSAVNESLEIVTPGGVTLRCGSAVEPSRLAALLSLIMRCEQEPGSC